MPDLPPLPPPLPPRCRLRNIQNASVVDLEDVTFQYWFNGPAGSLPVVAEYDPGQVFLAKCEWATTGCETVNLTIALGDVDVPGARFAVNVSMGPGAGSLLPSGENAVPSLFLGQGIDVMDLLVTITTRQGLVTLNSSADYSFLDTPELPTEGNATIVKRRAVTNPRIPAFVNGTQVWGALPPTGWAPGSAAPAPAAEGGAGMTTGTSNGAALPAGVTCVALGGAAGAQSCNLAATYCCVALDGAEVSPFIPPDQGPEDALGPDVELVDEPGEDEGFCGFDCLWRDRAGERSGCGPWAGRVGGGGPVRAAHGSGLSSPSHPFLSPAQARRRRLAPSRAPPRLRRPRRHPTLGPRAGAP